MAEFSKAQYESLIAEINSGMSDFSTRLGQVWPVATAAVDHWYIPEPVRDAVLWIARETVEVGQSILSFFADLLKGAVAPIYMFFDAWDWMEVRGSASGVASTLSASHLTVDDSDWSGDARDAYVDAVGPQSQAAARISSIAGSTSTHLLACATAGSAFYLLLAGVLVKLIVAAIAAIAALGSVVFSWVGAGIVLEEAAIDTALVGSGLTALLAFLGAQAVSMVNLHGEAVDQTSFPAGKWPSATSSTFSDGTVLDGDADWSLAR